MCQWRDCGIPLQKTRFVVRSGKECRRLKRIWRPKLEKVPVPVLSSLNAPLAITSPTRSKYCSGRLHISWLSHPHTPPTVEFYSILITELCSASTGKSQICSSRASWAVVL